MKKKQFIKNYLKKKIILIINFFFMNLLSRKIFLFSIIDCLNSTSYSSNSRPYTNIMVDIENCYFERVNTANIQGGIIHISSQEMILIVKNSIFYKILSTGDGGAIYYNCQTTTSKVNILQICAKECCSNNNGQFIYSKVRNINNENYFDFISISFSSYLKSGINTILAHFGNQRIYNYNSSYNYNYQTTGFYSAFPNQLNSNFNNLINNRVVNSICIYLSGGANERLFYYNNFINNSSPEWLGLFNLDSYAHYNLNNCFFQNNLDRLFYIFQGTIYLSNCIINHVSTSISYGNLIQVSNNTITHSNSNFEKFSLKHFSTYLCITEENYNFIYTKENKQLIIFFSLMHLLI